MQNITTPTQAAQQQHATLLAHYAPLLGMSEPALETLVRDYGGETRLWDHDPVKRKHFLLFRRAYYGW